MCTRQDTKVAGELLDEREKYRNESEVIVEFRNGRGEHLNGRRAVKGEKLTI